MLFVGTSIIHPSTEGVFLLCNILDLLIYSLQFIFSYILRFSSKAAEKSGFRANSAPETGFSLFYHTIL